MLVRAGILCTHVGYILDWSQTWHENQLCMHALGICWKNSVKVFDIVKKSAESMSNRRVFWTKFEVLSNVVRLSWVFDRPTCKTKTIGIQAGVGQGGRDEGGCSPLSYGNYGFFWQKCSWFGQQHLRENMSMHGRKRCATWLWVKKGLIVN